MNRRQFLVNSSFGTIAVGAANSDRLNADDWTQRKTTVPAQPVDSNDVRAMFPRLERERFLNAAGGTPLSKFVEAGAKRFEEFWRLGPRESGNEYFKAMLSETRRLFANLIGAETSEIALVHCTKAGEQIVLDGLPSIRSGGNIVTNDLHFSGSLHNLLGLRRSGIDVRIVKSTNWSTDLEAMQAAIDQKTALVTVSLVSNINGHMESMRQLADTGHRNGALVFADIIQAAGIVPLNVRELGIDFAACSGYKWLFGPHGAGFFFAAKQRQGADLPDRLFPGHVQHNYAPWTEATPSGQDDYLYDAPSDAQRYQPGHVSYWGYACLHEGLKFIASQGVDRLLNHSTSLTERLNRQLDNNRFRRITPQIAGSPIITYLSDDRELPNRLAAEKLVVGIAGRRIRISPAIYNNEDDIDRLVMVMNNEQ